MPTAESPFVPRFENLPLTLPIFPLERALLLPRQELPLNIFEPRYLQMVLDALGSGRLIGMVQPRQGSKPADPVPVYRVGCAGRITFFQETSDGRLLIQLTGVCRFEIAEEIENNKPYRSVRPAWGPFMSDLEPSSAPALELDQLENRLQQYAASHQLQIKWDALRRLPTADLVDFLAVQLPFDVAEKQALIEAKDVATRADVLCRAIDMNVQSPAGFSSLRH